MADVILSPNMNLPVPVVGTDPGPDWATNINASLSILDSHNHTPGQGNLITPAAISIDSTLPFGNHGITGLKSAIFTSQVSVSDLKALYVSGVDLYYNDGSGNPPIQITSGGAVNATSFGISSGTASASFVSSVLVVNADVTTPANVQCGSVLLGNNIAGSHYLTLSPPNAMASDFQLFLPSLPATTKIMTLDNAGNMAASYVVDNSTLTISAGTIQVANGGITTTQIAAGTIVSSNIAAGTIAGSNLALSAQQIISITAYTSSATVTAPTGATHALVTLVGGGGGGGGGGSVSTGGGGGGGGGNAGQTICEVVPAAAGDVFTLTIGTGGTGGVAVPPTFYGGYGGSGDPTYFYKTSGSQSGRLVAFGGDGGNGGLPGSFSLAGPGGTGGTIYNFWLGADATSIGGYYPDPGASSTLPWAGAGGGGGGRPGSFPGTSGGSCFGVSGGAQISDGGGGGGAGGGSSIALGGVGGAGGAKSVSNPTAGAAGGIGAGGGGGGGGTTPGGTSNGWSAAGGDGGAGYAIVAFIKAVS